MLAGVVQRLMHRLRAQAEAKLNALPLSYIDQQARGDLLSRVTNDLDNLAQSLQQTLSQMLTSVLLLIGVAGDDVHDLAAAGAWSRSPPCRCRSTAMQHDRRRGPGPRFIAQWRSTGALNAQIEEAFTGHADREGVRPPAARSRSGSAPPTTTLYEARFGAQFMSSLMQPLTMFLGNVQYVLVAVVGGLRVASGAITVGDVQAFIQYSRTFSMPLTQLASMMNVFQSGIASLERVLELLDAEEQTPDPAERDPTPRRSRAGSSSTTCRSPTTRTGR